MMMIITGTAVALHYCKAYAKINRGCGYNKNCILYPWTWVDEINFCHFITALHVMQTQICDEISVRLSVWIVTKRKKDRSRFLYHTKEHLA